MSEDEYDPWDHIDWDLDFETFEWLVHLCDLFNVNEHGEREVDGWTVWPDDWEVAPLSDIPARQRQSWLYVSALVSRSPGIIVSGNEVCVSGRFGSEFKFEMMPNLSDWFCLEHPHCVPEELGSGYVPDSISLCWNCPEEVSFPICLYALLLALLDETKVWEYLTDYSILRCSGCGDTAAIHNNEHEADVWICYWCGPNAPEVHP